MGKEFTDQHIVPKCYLDRFGTKCGKKVVIGTRLNANGKVKFFPATTSDVGYIKNFYDVTDRDDPKYWEHFFAQEIDVLCGQYMENLIAKITLSRERVDVLSEKDKKMLAKVIIAQIMRVPRSLEHISKKIYPDVMKRVREKAITSLPACLIEEYRQQIMEIELPEQNQKESFFNFAFTPENFDRYCKLIQDGAWFVFVNAQREHMPFFTSDNPVLVEATGSGKIGVFHNGLANPATTLFYPLCPSIAVAIFSNRSIVGVAAKHLGIDGRKLTISEPKYVMDKNLKIIEQAYLHSFIPQPCFDIFIDEINNEFVEGVYMAK